MRSKRVFQYHVIDSELTAGIGFCRAAETSQDLSRKISNMESAERAYQAALGFIGLAKLTRKMRVAIEQKADRLRRLLDDSRRLERDSSPSGRPRKQTNKNVC